MRVMTIISGIILVVAAYFGGFVGLSGEGAQEIDVPSCSIGLDGFDICDKSAMLEQNVPIPEYVSQIVAVRINVEWDQPDAWIGIVAASEADKCTNTGDGYLLCDTEDLDIMVGGPASSGHFDWPLAGGDYRFVAGNSLDGSAQSTQVSYEYRATLTQTLTYGIALVGIALATYGAIRD
ncbi:MAG: hypothetical protein CXX72_04955 [Methanobacteriota archaeon]|nr:MAG: hypothetical protein CXX72_04955 [Euryarchaeota archaeon]